MLTLKRLFPRALAAILVACVAIGCSSEGKKSGFLKRGDRYFESGEYDKAKIEYLNVLRADPRNATAIRRLGTIWYEQGAPLNAAPFLLEARELAPDDLRGPDRNWPSFSCPWDNLPRREKRRSQFSNDPHPIMKRCFSWSMHLAVNGNLTMPNNAFAASMQTIKPAFILHRQVSLFGSGICLPRERSEARRFRSTRIRSRPTSLWQRFPGRKTT